MTPKQYVLVAVLSLEGDKVWFRVLHRGTLEACEAEQREIDSINWSGPEKVIEGFMRILAAEEWEKLLADARGRRGRFDEWNDEQPDAPMQVRRNEVRA